MDLKEALETLREYQKSRCLCTVCNDYNELQEAIQVLLTSTLIKYMS